MLSSFEKLFVGLYLIVGELVLVVQKFWLLGFFPVQVCLKKIHGVL